MKATRYIPVDAVIQNPSLRARQVTAQLAETGNNDAPSEINLNATIVCCNLPVLAACKQSWSKNGVG
jgi:hypothetical protein